jgi:signal transduction histidine kinase
LQVIDQEVSRMANLVASLLQFSRPAQQHVSTVDIHEELDKTLEIINYQFKKSEIGVVREYAAGLPMIQVDRQQLRQVFLNLLMNASDAMHAGGTIKLRTQASTLADGNPAITTEVADTGAGIPPENLAKIMEPFFTTKPEGKGTGLGLPICRRIIQEHKGTIEIASEIERGTTVRIVLPVAHTAGTDIA